MIREWDVFVILEVKRFCEMTRFSVLQQVSSNGLAECYELQRNSFYKTGRTVGLQVASERN